MKILAVFALCFVVVKANSLLGDDSGPKILMLECPEDKLENGKKASEMFVQSLNVRRFDIKGSTGNSFNVTLKCLAKQGQKSETVISDSATFNSIFDLTHGIPFNNFEPQQGYCLKGLLLEREFLQGKVFQQANSTCQPLKRIFLLLNLPMDGSSSGTNISHHTHYYESTDKTYEILFWLLFAVGLLVAAKFGVDRVLKKL